MSEITNKIAEVALAVDAALARSQADVAAMEAKIADFQPLVDEGVGSPADLKALEVLRAKVGALDPTKADVLPEPEPEPRPERAKPPEPKPEPEAEPESESEHPIRRSGRNPGHSR